MAAVKFFLPDYGIQVGCGPYISSFPPKKHHDEPCFGVANQVAPLLRFVTSTTTYNYTNMAEKQDQTIDLVEEDEEEWPEAGAQNPREAQQYVDRVNQVFDHLSTLIHEDVKDALDQTVKNLKKVVAKQ